MLKCGHQIRFTGNEIKEDRGLGLDTSWVKTESDLSAELVQWIQLIAENEPHILQALGRELEQLGYDLSSDLPSSPISGQD